MSKYSGNDHSQAENDNHANQMNSNSDEYWESRDYDERPDDWEDRAREDEDE